MIVTEKGEGVQFSLQTEGGKGKGKARVDDDVSDEPMANSDPESTVGTDINLTLTVQPKLPDGFIKSMARMNLGVATGSSTDSEMPQAPSSSQTRPEIQLWLQAVDMVEQQVAQKRKESQERFLRQTANYRKPGLLTPLRNYESLVERIAAAERLRLENTIQRLHLELLQKFGLVEAFQRKEL